MNSLTITLKNIWHRKIGTGLTVLGVGVSVAAFVSFMGLANNLEETLKTIYDSRGTDLVVVEKGSVDILSSAVDEGYFHEIKQLPGVVDVSRVLLYLYAATIKQRIFVYGWDINSHLFDELKISGTSPQNQGEAILGNMASGRLNKKIGDKINIKGSEFSVVGIFQSKSLFEEGAIIVSLKKLQEIKGASNKVTSFNVKVKKRETPKGRHSKTTNTVEAVQSEISSLFPDVEVKNIQSFVFANTPLLTLLNFTWAISVVAFLIVILGIVNTMTTSVLERTREIGILLAMGWRNTRIIGLVLYESILLGLFGGLIGVAMGYGIMKYLVSTPQLQSIMRMNYDVVFMVKAIAISLFLGFISGIYPALKAISIPPIEVLRYE